MRGISVIALALMISLWSALPAAGQDSPGAAGPFKLGENYEMVAKPGVLAEKDDGRVEVISFFWYNCASCFGIDPEVTRWAEKLPADVRFLRMPATFNPAVNFHGRIFMTLQALELGQEANHFVFERFRQQRKPVNDYKQLRELAVELKVDPDKFVAAFDSPEVARMMDHLDEIALAYDIPGVPAMVIDGKYRFDIGTTDGAEGFFQLADILIEEQRQLRQKEGRGPK